MQEFREQLTLVYLSVSDVIGLEDYVYLYSTNQSRKIFPYWKFNKFDFETWDDAECYKELCFRKDDIPNLLICLGTPDKVVCSQGTSCTGLEGLCILLKRLAYPCRYTNMVSRFGRNPAEICLILNEMLSLVFNTHHHRLESLEQPFLSPKNLSRYADSIHAHGAPLQNCFGFIDGTVRKIARPNKNQKTMYNGYKRVHAMKFQSVVVPDGLIANLSGPYEGKRNEGKRMRNYLNTCNWML